MPVPGVGDRSVAEFMLQSRVGILTRSRQNTYPAVAVDHVFGYQPRPMGNEAVM